MLSHSATAIEIEDIEARVSELERITKRRKTGDQRPRLNGGLQIRTSKLNNRIAKLERVHAAWPEEARRQAQSEQHGSFVDLIDAYLTAHGFGPLPKESLAEATSRALGYDVAELQACILENRFRTELLKRFESPSEQAADNVT